jgi:anti-sigma regulatory factor (Ser/Thr protein kinase)
MSPTLTIELPRDLQTVGDAALRLGRFLEGQSVGAETVYQVTLSMEEVVTNIIKYAFDDAGEHRIRLECEVDDEAVVLRSIDDGQEFDPQTISDPDLEVPCEDRPIGGLGIHIIRHISEGIEYRRSDEQNILTLRFRRACEPPCRRTS